MKNITFSAEASLLEAARARARAEHTTLDAAFRDWLAGYALDPGRLRNYDEVMAELRGMVRVGRKLTRNEVNER